jgi:hypothetical protein
LIVEEWAQQADKAPWSGIEVQTDRRRLGLAAEYRIGLDLAPEPGYRDLLSFLPPMECNILLRGAGYHPSDREHIVDTGTTDPLLLEWVRVRHPIALSEAQRLTLAACWGMAEVHELVNLLGPVSTAERRSWYVRQHSVPDARMGSWRRGAVDALSHLWQGYLRHGRQQLTGLGQRVVLAPSLAGGFGIADLIVGRCLVEIKTVLEPAKSMEQWLNQLLGYALLDWFDALYIDSVALYLGWQAKLMRMPLTEVLAVSAPGHTPELGFLRADFRQAIQADVDQTHQWQLHKLYPPSS